MGHTDIRIPQLGEGLQEARIVRFLKLPGDAVARDEPIFEMETDKAVMEIESPCAGQLLAWSAAVDDVLPIGAVIGQIDGEALGQEAAVTSIDGNSVDTAGKTVTPHPDVSEAGSVPSERLTRAGMVSPRTRNHARALGVSEAELAALVERTESKLLPEDLDRYMAGRSGTGAVTTDDLAAQAAVSATAPGTGPGYMDVQLSPRQKTLNHRLQQASKSVVPAYIEMPVNWSSVERLRTRFKQNNCAIQPSQFLLFAWCVAAAVRNHTIFRSALINESTVRRYESLNLGLAVARPDDELFIARVDAADSLPLGQFVQRAQAAIAAARAGTDQAADTMQMSLTHMAGVGVRRAIPVIAAPAIATLFVGEAYNEAVPGVDGGIGFQRSAIMVLSFDHRLVNGIGAANFMADVRRSVEAIGNSTDPEITGLNP